MKNHVFCYNYFCVNVCETYNVPLLYENRTAKRANSHYTICSLLTLTLKTEGWCSCFSLSLNLSTEKSKKYLKMSKL